MQYFLKALFFVISVAVIALFFSMIGRYSDTLADGFAIPSRWGAAVDEALLKFDKI